MGSIVRAGFDAETHPEPNYEADSADVMRAYGEFGMDMPRLSIKDAIGIVPFSRNKLFTLLDAGEIKHANFSGLIKICEKSLRAYLAKCITDAK